MEIFFIYRRKVVGIKKIKVPANQWNEMHNTSSSHRPLTKVSFNIKSCFSKEKEKRLLVPFIMHTKEL